MKKYRSFVESVMGGEDKSPLSERLHAVILGGQGFIEEIKADFLSDRQPDRELPDLNAAPKKTGLDEIEKAVDQVLISDKKFARQVKLYFSHRYTGLKLKEIGNWYGIGESGVTQASRRVALKVETEKKVSKIIKRIVEFVHVQDGPCIS